MAAGTAGRAATAAVGRISTDAACGATFAAPVFLRPAPAGAVVSAGGTVGATASATGNATARRRTGRVHTALSGDLELERPCSKSARPADATFDAVTRFAWIAVFIGSPIHVVTERDSAPPPAVVRRRVHHRPAGAAGICR
jgi:hypothetical protein